MALHKKRGVGATPEAKEKRIAALRAVSTKPQTAESYATNNPDRPLTEKQIAFAKLWAGGENPKNAALKAGFSPNSTIDWKLRNDPAILKIYNEEKKKYEEACHITRKDVMDGLLGAADQAKLMADPQATVAAWREIAKILGYYAPVATRIDVNLQGSVLVQRLQSLSDADLLKLIEAPAIEGESQRVDTDGSEDDDPG